MKEARAAELSHAWIADWNAHELKAIMAHSAADVVFQAPTIIATLGVSDGRVVGHAALSEHFARGLARIPDLRFDLERIYAGVSSVLITYRWRDGTPVAELHEYGEAERIVRVQALYVGLNR